MHVCLERIRINEPERYKKIIDRASYRSKMSRRRKTRNDLRKEVKDLEDDLIKARVRQVACINSKAMQFNAKCRDLYLQGTKQLAFISNLKKRIRTKKATMRDYEKELAEYEKTKKRNVPAKKYKKEATSSESSEDDAVST